MFWKNIRRHSQHSNSIQTEKVGKIRQKELIYKLSEITIPSHYARILKSKKHAFRV